MPTAEEILNNPVVFGTGAAFVTSAADSGRSTRSNKDRMPGLALSRQLISMRYGSDFKTPDRVTQLLQSCRDLTGDAVEDEDLKAAQDAVDRWTGVAVVRRGVPSRHIVLPFDGFYETWVDRSICLALDEIDEDLEGGAGDSLDIPGCYRDFAKLYTLEFERLFPWLFWGSETFEFSFVDHPKSYNFRSDRIFAVVGSRTIDRLFAISAGNGHNVLKRILKQECQSYEGHLSYYKPELELYTAKQLALWDHNEITLLTMAVAEVQGTSWENLKNDLKDRMEDRVQEICAVRTDRSKKSVKQPHRR